jgi:hypothetical protein
MTLANYLKVFSTLIFSKLPHYSYLFVVQYLRKGNIELCENDVLEMMREGLILRFSQHFPRETEEKHVLPHPGEFVPLPSSKVDTPEYRS